MLTTSDLVEKGFFPRELPPAFSTAELAAALPAIRSSLQPNRPTALTNYSIPGSKNIRRFLGIPNPKTQILLCDEISSRWSDIETHYSRTDISLSRPIPTSARQRAASPRVKFGKLPQKQLLAFPECRFVLHCDTSRYYTSLYTHIIPWALHGKDVAKQHIGSRNLWGNELDRLVRNTQEKQTKGIPIGPDTSLILSEIVGSEIDCRIMNEFGAQNIRGHRYLDDYFLFFWSEEEANRCKSVIARILRDYELELNADKSRVVKLPESLENDWSESIRSFGFRFDEEQAADDICAFFNMAFRYASKCRDEQILKSALAKVKRWTFSEATWSTLEPLLLRSTVVDPSGLPVFCQILFAYDKANYPINKSSIRSALVEIVRYHCSLGESHEVAWALWTLKSLRISIPEAVANGVTRMRDPVAGLVLLDLNDRGLVDGTLELSAWNALLDSKELITSNWLFVYEANVHGWLRRADNLDFVAADPFFGLLKSNDVYFYQSSVKPVTDDVAIRSSQSMDGDYSDYSDRDDDENY